MSWVRGEKKVLGVRAFRSPARSGSAGQRRFAHTPLAREDQQVLIEMTGRA